MALNQIGRDATKSVAEAAWTQDTLMNSIVNIPIISAAKQISYKKTLRFARAIVKVNYKNVKTTTT